MLHLKKNIEMQAQNSTVNASHNGQVKITLTLSSSKQKVTSLKSVYTKAHAIPHPGVQVMVSAL